MAAGARRLRHGRWKPGVPWLRRAARRRLDRGRQRQSAPSGRRSDRRGPDRGGRLPAGRPGTRDARCLGSRRSAGIHRHDGAVEINVLIDNRVLSKITQGVTTELTGEGGSVAPLTDKLALDDSDAMKKWHYREDWRDLDGYIAQLAQHRSAVNIATFVGATQVRLAVVGKE